MTTIGDLKNGNAAGLDGIMTEMLKYGGETIIIEWMHKTCGSALEEGKLPKVWPKAIIIQVYKGKGSKSECENYGDINPFSIV